MDGSEIGLSRTARMGGLAGLFTVAADLESGRAL